MNKNQYRVIFNKARGMMVVVAETAVSHGSNSSNTSGDKSTLSSQDVNPPTQWIKLNRSLQLTRLSTLCLLMSGLTLTTSIAQAQIIADPKAPKNQQAVILNTANGLPQINIQTPNASGVSINTYSQFDVEKNGAVLNNSAKNVQTKLAGLVQGNPLLIQGARIILNEVNSANPSQLLGYLEVAGQRAQVIVANPSGINCNGCGFINASRATLTTGTPVFNSGNLDSYRVTKGTITVGGQGLDGTTTDFTDLIAHAVQINAGIWANQLNVITGVNTVGAANTISGSTIPVAPTTASEAAPQFSIDVAALGGMYAGQITLVGTETGVGVRNAGQIGTTAGDIVVTAEGKLQNSGTIFSKANTVISTQADLSNSGTIASTQNLTINSVKGLNNSGTLDATAQLDIADTGTVSNTSASIINAGESLNLRTSQLINAGQIASGGTAAITVQNNINNAAGVIDGQRLVLSATGDLNNQGGQIVQTGTTDLDLTTSNLINNLAGVIGQPIVTNIISTDTTGTGSTTNSGSSTTSTGNSSSTTGSSGSSTTGSSRGVVLSHGTLKVTGALNNTGGEILTTGNTNIITQNLNNKGGQLSLGQLSITGASFINDQGQLLVAQNLSSKAAQLSNASGLIAVGGTLNAQATQIDNLKGSIQAGNLQLTANHIDNTQGTLLQTSAVNDAKITVLGQLIQQNGQIESAGNLNLQVGSLTGTVGKLNTLGDLELTGGNLSLVSGLVHSNGKTTITGTTVDNNLGQIDANQQLTINANTLTNTSGTIQSLGNVNLTVLEDLNNTVGGKILSGNELNVTVSGLLNNNQGKLGSVGTPTTGQFNIEAQSLQNEQGLILQTGNAQANNLLYIDTPYIQHDGLIQTQGNLELSVNDLTLSNHALTVLGSLDLSSETTNFSNATLYIEGNATLSTADLNNNNGSLTVKGSLNIDSSSVENIGGLIQSNGLVTIQTTGLLNNALLGQILSSQDISINAQGINNVDGTIAGNNVNIDTNGLQLENYYGSIIANQNLSLNTGAIANDAGLLQASKDLNIDTNGQVISNTNSPLNAQTPMPQSSLPLGLFTPAFFLFEKMAFQYQGNNTDPLIATIESGVLTLKPTVNYDDGGVTATFTLIPPTIGATYLIDSGNRIWVDTTSPAYRLTALTLDNKLLPPVHTTGILSGTSIEITSGLLNNTHGVISTLGSLSLNLAGLDNTSGLIQSTNDLSINITPDAVIPNADAFSVFNSTNYKGKIESNSGSVSITDLNHTFTNGLGLVFAAQNINMNLQSLVNCLEYTDDPASYNQGGIITANNINIKTGFNIINIDNAVILAKNDINLEISNPDILLNQVDSEYSYSEIDNFDSLIQAGETLTVNTNGKNIINVNTTQTPNTNLGLIASTINLQNVNTLKNEANIYSSNTLNINVNTLTMDTTNLLWTENGFGNPLSTYIENSNTANGNIASNNDLNITTQNLSSLNGTILAKNNITLTSPTSVLDNAAQIQSMQGEVSIQTPNGSFKNLGGINGATNVSLQNLVFSNTGIIYAPDIQIETYLVKSSRYPIPFGNTSGGSIVAGNNLSIDSDGSLTNDAALIQAGQTLTIDTHGQKLSNTNDQASTLTKPLGIIAPDLQILSVSALDNSQGIIYTPNSLDLDLGGLTNKNGNITSGDQLTITTSGSLNNADGTLIAANALELMGTSISNAGGTIGSISADISLETTQGIIDNTANGQIISTSAITLDSHGLNNGGIINASNIQIETSNQALNNTLGGSIKGNTLSITAGKLTNSASLIQAEKTLTINTNGQNIDNTNDQNATAANPLGIIASNLQLQNVATLTNSGLIYTPNTLSLDLAQFNNKAGNITTDDQLSIHTSGAIDNSSGGTLSAINAITLTGTSINNSAGKIGSTHSDVNLNATQGTIDNTQSGQIKSLTAIVLNSHGLNNGGVISAPSIQIKANNQAFKNTSGGTVVAGDTLSIDSGVVTNDASLIQAGQTLTLNTHGQNLSNTNDQNSTDTSLLGIIAANLQLQNVASLDNSNGIISAQNSLNLTQLTNTGGSITSGDQLMIDNTGVFNNKGGTLVANNALHLSATSINNAGGQIGSKKGDVTLLASQGIIDNTSRGKILSHNVLILNSQGLNNGGVIFAPDVHIQTNNQALNNTQGSSIAANTLSIDSGLLTNDASLIQSGQTLTINTHGKNLSNTNDQAATTADPLGIIAPNLQLQNIATLDNSKGDIYSPNNLNLSLTQLTNQGGSITSGDQLTIIATGSLNNNNGGTLGATNAIDLIGTTISNTGGLIGSNQGQVSVHATQGTIDNSSGGQVSATTILHLDSFGLLNNGGKLTSATTTIDTHGLTLDNSGSGKIIATHSLAIDSGTLNNDSGLLQGGQNLTLNTHGANLINTNTLSADATKPLGLLSVGSILLNQANILDNTSGSINAGGQLTLNADTTQNNSNGVITGLQNVNINGNSLQNLGGQIEANGTLVINMGGSTGNGSVDNQGLINASTTVITAGTVNNIGGNAKIYGDKIAIGAQTLNNTPANGAAPVIAARQDLELGVQILNNNPNVNPNSILTANNGALILSLGNLNIGGSLDDNNNAIGQAQQVNNLSSTLQSGGSMNINTANLLNMDVYFAYAPVTQASTAEDYWTLNSSVYYTQLNGTTEGQGVTGPSEFGHIPTNQVTLKSCYNDSSKCNVTYGTTVKNGVQYNADNYTEYRTTKTVTSDQLTVSDSAKILVGGDLNLLGNTITTNQNSQIIVGGSLIGNLNNLHNEATQGSSTTHETGTYDNYYFNRRSCCHDRTQTTGWLAYNPADITSSAPIVGTEGFQPLQYTTSQSAGTAGNAANAAQQGLANSSGGYNGNNSSTAINAQNASGDTGSKATASSDSSGNFANTQSTTVHALSTSLTAQTTATSAINSANIGAAPSLLQLANDIAPALSNSLSPTNISQQINAESIAGHTAVLNTPPQFKGILATLPNLALPQIALYQINSSPTATYIVETDPKFLNPASAGSLANATTLLQDLQTTSNITQKLIGDAFYQQQLVNQQIGALTGKAFISGYNTTNSEYAALLTNGATFASQYGLTLGIGLTATQMAQLTSDIVWLVSEPITLPDGRVENALVPQVYLIPRAGDVNGNGTLISANQIQLTATDDVINSGTIAGERVVVINANNISNTGDIAGTQVGLNALNDLKIIGGTVNADQKLVITAGRDVDVTTTTQSTSNTVGASSYIQTSIDRIAGLYLGNSAHPSAKGLLSISAGHDIHLTAADISNQSIDGTTQLDAGNSVNLDTVTTAVQNNMIQNAKNYVKMGNSQDVGTQISTQGNLLVHADNQINATAATLNSANGTLQLTAKDISINNGTATDSFANANVTKKNGFLSHATITAADSLSNTHALGSSLGGKDVVISANHDLIVTVSQIIGDNSTTLAAENNLIIQNAIDTNSTSQIHDEKKSGLLSAGSSTIGFTIGKKQQTDTSTTSSRSAAASTIGSVNGNVNIIAGNQYTQTGSDIQTPNGDTNIIAKNITIQNAQDVSNNTQDQKTMQSGLTLAITNPIASAAQSIKQMADAAGKTDSNRMKTLAGASAALTAYNTKNSLKDDPMGQDGKRIGPNGTTGQTATQKAEDIRVSLTYGASQSHSHSEQDGTTASSSHITAGGDVNLIATGDKNNDQGDINIIGSDINAGHNVSLDAANTISILAAQDTNTNTSRNTSSSGAIGVAASAKDHSLGATASASYGQGNTDGHDVTQVNSHITAGSGSTAGTASLTSGGDTIIKGGVITANTIDADVGGNLTIESLQDTSTYKSHQIDASGSVTVGYGAGASGSLGMSQVTSDYASVTEQSGLKAGDGGFNVKVKGSTDLKGGAISSTQAAIDDGKNSFSSTTLTTSDIDNHASYEANSVSVSASTGGSGSAGVGHDTGSASSVTLSGISGIAGNTTARTGDAETGISKIFDATKVQSEIDAQTQITSAFGSQASKAIGDYATTQEAKAAALRIQAGLITDPEQYKSLMAQADQIDSEWGAKGTLRLGAHAIVGGLTGGVSGAVGVTAGALTAPEVAKQLAAANITGSLASTLTALASTAVGVATGGTAGGATAYNEVNNNYLTHQQQQDLLNTLKGCDTSKCRDDAISAAKVTSAKQDADLKKCEFNGDQACISKAINEIFVAQNSPTSTELTSYLGLQDAGLVNNSGTLINDSQIKASIDWLSYAKNSCQGMSSGQCAINYEQMKNGDIPALVRLKDGTKDNLIGGKTSGLMYYIKGVGYVAAEILIPTTPTDIALSLMPVGKLVGKLDATIATGEKTLVETVPLASCGGTACFVAGTLIQTNKGLKAIETFVGGEMVWARNDQTLEYGYRPVVTTKATADQALYEVIVGNTQGQTETYYTTSEHPFWVKDHGWRKASLLEAGMTLVDRHNEPIQIISQLLTSDIDTVFNIQVQDSETYHIGEFGVWVHNAKCCDVVAQPVLEPTKRGVISNTKLNNNIEIDLNTSQTKQAQEIALNGDSKGVKTEALVNDVVKSQDGHVLDGGKYGSNNGYDHVIVYKDANGNTTLTMILDSKQLGKKGVTLDPTAAGGKLQMSSEWDDVVLNRLDSNSPAFKAIEDARKSGTLVKGVAYVDKSTGKLMMARIDPKLPTLPPQPTTPKK